MAQEPTNPYSPPAADINRVPDVGTGSKLSIKQLLFSFRGRIPRKPFWALTLALSLVVGVLAGIVDALDGDSSSVLAPVLIIPIYVVLLWTTSALSVKRWHDRDKTGWWILIGLIPIVGGIWTLVEMGLLRGTVGPNRFGSDSTGSY